MRSPEDMALSALNRRRLTEIMEYADRLNSMLRCLNNEIFTGVDIERVRQSVDHAIDAHRSLSNRGRMLIAIKEDVYQRAGLSQPRPPIRACSCGTMNEVTPDHNFDQTFWKCGAALDVSKTVVVEPAKPEE